MTKMEVKMGEMAFSRLGDTLAAPAIGSCLVISIYDVRKKVGGLAHAAVPDDISKLLDVLLKEIYGLGGKGADMEAKIAGGANMFGELSSDDLGSRNIFSAKEKLKKEGIFLAGEAVGGSIGRSVEFYTDSGIMTVKIKF